MTAVARNGVLPLATQFFSLAAIEYPSAVDGTLAPGMAVKATVRFEPDSLANYEDHLSVKTEGGEFRCASGRAATRRCCPSRWNSTSVRASWATP